MKETLCSQKYSVNSFLVTPEKKLGLYGLLNLIQDIAWIHAINLGHGHDKMSEEKTGWVLTRQKLLVSKWPRWGREIELKTWIRPSNGVGATRDFEIWSENDKIGLCSTQWLAINLEDRKLSENAVKRIENDYRQDFPTPFIQAKKVVLKSQLEKLAEFKVRNSDLDLNGHVNNTRYAQWILDSISRELHPEDHLAEYEINFIAETKANDTIHILRADLANGKYQFQGMRLQDQKIVFAANLHFSAEQLPPLSVSS